MDQISLPLAAFALWVVAATAVALMPMRRQYAPGLALLLAAPALICWIAVAHGWIWAVLGFGAFVSMFRRPLVYILGTALRRART